MSETWLSDPTYSAWIHFLLLLMRVGPNEIINLIRKRARVCMQYPSNQQCYFFAFVQFEPVMVYNVDNLNVARYTGYNIDIFNIIADAFNFR